MTMTNQELVDLVTGALGKPGPLTDEQMLRLLQRMADVIKYSPTHRDGHLRSLYLAVVDSTRMMERRVADAKAEEQNLTDKVQAPV